MSCNCCKPRIALPIVETDEVLLSMNRGYAGDLEKICFRLCSLYASPSPTVPVVMILNEEKAPLLDRLGRPVFSNQLKAGCSYEGYYVLIEDVPHLSVMNLPLNIPSSCSCGEECR